MNGKYERGIEKVIEGAKQVGSLKNRIKVHERMYAIGCHIDRATTKK